MEPDWELRAEREIAGRKVHAVVHDWLAVRGQADDHGVAVLDNDAAD